MPTAMRCRAAAATILAIGLLSGCNTPAVLSNRAVDFNETAARAGDSQLLLNIVRAAYRNPTRYTAISQLREARVEERVLQVTGQFPFGHDALRAFSLNPMANVRRNEQPSFDVVPLDNRAAALGLFRPIDPQIFVTYWRQGWPRSVLLFLLVDDVVVNSAAKAACGLSHIRGERIDNTAYSPETFATIQKFFTCLRGAIRLVERPHQTQFLTDAPVSPNVVLKTLPELQKGEFTIKERAFGNKRYYSVSKSTKRFTFELNFNGRPGVGRLTTQTDSVRPMPSSVPAVVFNMRSVDGMIYYLGELVRAQLRGDPPALVAVGTDTNWETLFKVDLDVGRERGDRIEIEYLGTRFSVARIGAEDDRSLTVLSLVSQLFSLYREATELPKTTAVQVVGTP